MNLLEKAMKKLTEAKEIEVNEEDIITNPDNVEEIEETNEAKEIEVNEEDIITDPENVDEVEESKGTYLEVLESDLKNNLQEGKVGKLDLRWIEKEAPHNMRAKEFDNYDDYDKDGNKIHVIKWVAQEAFENEQAQELVDNCFRDLAIEDVLKKDPDVKYVLIKISDRNSPAEELTYEIDREDDLDNDDLEESKENHGNKTTELNDNDPALKKPYESETVRDISKEMKALKNEDKEIEEAKEDKYKKYLDAAKERMGRDLTSEEISLLKAFVDIEEMEMEMEENTEKEVEPKTEDLLKETGEWDEEDDEMASWKEDLKEQSKELASRINGEVKSVIGIDKYQGPEAVISTPNYGDITLMYDSEDDTGRSFVAKVAHLGLITGDINHLVELLNSNDIPEDEVIVENVNKASFNVMLTKFIKENYKNAKNLRINKVTKVTEGYNIEASLKLKNEQVVPVTFLAKGTITEGKTSILKIYENKVFKNMDENKNIMTMIVSNNGSLKLEKLKYNFNTKLTENKKANVYGIIK